MGVTGLWRLIEPAGKPVPIEILENKVLAVDISIWLHQVVKGYQDAKGAPLPNAHLIGLFQRLCKLLYFRIKPIFVFDGGLPDLKKETIAKRQESKLRYNSESERIKRDLAILLCKKAAVNTLLGKHISSKIGKISNEMNKDDMFKLPALPDQEQVTESESEDEQDSSGSVVDLHSVDIESEKFKNLPIKEKYDLLVELKETRKMNSWGRLHELPKKSEVFSDFQMQRLLKRKKVQDCLEQTEQEMGGDTMSYNELEMLLNDEGINTKIESLPTRRIASDKNTRFLLIKNVKQALAEAKKKQESESNSKVSIVEKEEHANQLVDKNDKELSDDVEKAIKMSLECIEPEEEPENIANTSTKTDDSWATLSDSESIYSYSEDDDGFDQPDMTSAKAYIKQYSDFTNRMIDKLIVGQNHRQQSVNENINVEKVLQELQEETCEDKIIEKQKGIFSECDNKSVINDDIHNISESENSKLFDKKAKVILDSDNVDDNSKLDIDSLHSSVVHKLNEQSNIIQICLDNEVVVKSDVTDIQLSMNEDSDQEVIELTEISKHKGSSESSDADDFEEVTEVERTRSPVVQISLDYGDVLEDDIFADIFDNTSKEKPGISQTEKVDLNLPQIDHTKNIESNSFSATRDVTSMKSKVIDSDDKTLNESQLLNVKNNNSSLPQKERITSEKLNIIAEAIQSEEINMMKETGRLDRIGRNITEQMTKEAQELLKIFGIPYIVAPMEAEAQCAFLESVNLTDGTITDDSDIWLFGGKTVYKNFFNQKKNVLQFISERIERSFNLTREQLILFALLVGSDYTTGVNGVGPVTALEILASFPINKRNILQGSSNYTRYNYLIAGLKEFKQWIKTGRRTDNINLKKKLKNVSISDDFPSTRVVQAYLEPNIEKSEEKFSWGQLDITVLRDYTKAKFGWSQSKLDEIIKPVLKRMLDPKRQKAVDDYFQKKIGYQSLENHMSKRVKAAVDLLSGFPNEITQENKERKNPVTEIKRKVNNKTPQEAGPSKPKQKKKVEKSVLTNQVVVTEIKDGRSEIEINIPKTDRMQEIIPQREKDKRNLLENKMKAIEIFRKTKIDKKRKVTKRKKNIPKDKADLSESSGSA